MFLIFIIGRSIIGTFYFLVDRITQTKNYIRKSFGNALNCQDVAVNGGTLIVTEVGVMKKEITYHGVVLNTATRIQGECYKCNEKLMVSLDLSGDLSMAQRTIKMLGEVALRGKLQPIAIHAVH